MEGGEVSEGKEQVLKRRGREKERGGLLWVYDLTRRRRTCNSD